MNTRLYVGSIPYTAKEVNLAEFFEQAGEVVYVKVIRNKETKLSRGFGFVEMASEEDAKAALKLNGSQMGKCKIVVKEAFDNEDFKNQKNKEDENNGRT